VRYPHGTLLFGVKSLCNAADDLGQLAQEHQQRTLRAYRSTRDVSSFGEGPTKMLLADSLNDIDLCLQHNATDEKRLD
jgi:hypothetical protein